MKAGAGKIPPLPLDRGLLALTCGVKPSVRFCGIPGVPALFLVTRQTTECEAAHYRTCLERWPRGCLDHGRAGLETPEHPLKSKCRYKYKEFLSPANSSVIALHCEQKSRSTSQIRILPFTMPVTQFAFKEKYSYQNGFNSYHEYASSVLLRLHSYSP